LRLAQGGSVSQRITPRVLAEALAASYEAKRAFDATMSIERIDVAAIKAVLKHCSTNNLPSDRTQSTAGPG
jgi:hypothetical protein